MKNAIRRFYPVIGSLLLMFGTFCHAGYCFTIEEILNAPFPSKPVAGTNCLAWNLYEQGEENLWFASEPEFRPVKLTRYEAEDGQKLSSLVLSPDGSILVYVRGESPM